MTAPDWQTLAEVPEKYRPCFREGEQCCNSGGELTSNPYPLFTNRRRAWRAGWRKQHHEITDRAEILRGDLKKSPHESENVG